MFRQFLPSAVFSGAVDGGGDAAPAGDAPAAITTGLEGGSVLGAATNADAVAAAAPAEPTEPSTLAEQPKPGEPPAPDMKAEDYGTFDLPEGVQQDDPLVQAFISGAAKGGMDKDSVQAVISELGPKLQEQLMAPQRAWQDMNAAWANQVKMDTQLGGANLDKTLSTITAGLTQVMTPQELGQLHEALETTGAGNHPAVVRALHRFAARVTEGGHVSGDAGKSALSFAERMYPSHRAGAN
jgi:hypothetical protein